MGQVTWMDRQSYVWWRATFFDAATPDMQMTIEFMAPKAGSSTEDLQRYASRRFRDMLEQKTIKIKDIEPVET